MIIEKEIEHCNWCDEEIPCECALAMVRYLDERINKLEKMYKADYEIAKDIIFSGSQTHLSVLKLQASVEEIQNLDHDERINDLENIQTERRLLSVEERVKDIEYRLNAIVELPTDLDVRLQECERILDIWALKIVGKKPHKCPVCDGRCAIYEETEKKIYKFTFCNSCDGKGIVWG